MACTPMTRIGAIHFHTNLFGTPSLRSTDCSRSQSWMYCTNAAVDKEPEMSRIHRDPLSASATVLVFLVRELTTASEYIQPGLSPGWRQ
jgi:hypothetical protein